MRPSLKLYLAGPMSGHKDHNFPAFRAEAARLRDLGFTIVSPAELNLDVDRSRSPDSLWRECMRKDIHALIECDGIILMHNWEGSRGACLEYQIALGLKLDVLFCKDIT